MGTKHSPLKIQVERTIKAPAAKLFAIVTDVERMAELSPECTNATWQKGATGPAVGAVFKGKNKLGSATWSTKPVVTEVKPGRAFSFKVPGKSGPTWRYQFIPTNDGETKVVESMDQTKPSGAFIRFLQRRNGVTNRQAHLTESMHTTLERLALAAEA